MATYKTALGKPLDMSALASRNSKVRAVGNMKVNARGDTIDGTGKVVTPMTEKVNNSYSKTVASDTKPVSKPNQQTIIKEQLTKDEKDIEDSFDDDIEVEKIKKRELKNGK